ncbi:hypothetical protein [Limisalsivibrio acetivorans]|uniref:hypothetical protein n=1 Tax=Limisalsivibrio acetivorans TaxID=1304888 RepID=UPI0003B60CFD|nr:hypothetical protein [Limisalsivibrio acetivorans]
MALRLALIGAVMMIAAACTTPKECRIAKNVLVMPPDYSVEAGGVEEFGSDLHETFRTKLENQFGEYDFSFGYESEDADLIIRSVIVSYAGPKSDGAEQKLGLSGTGNIEYSIRVFSGDGKFLRETYIMKDMKSGSRDFVIDSLTDDALTFVRKKCF